jgi:hypothetical protein
MVTGTGGQKSHGPCPAAGDWDWGKKSHGLCLTDGDWDWGKRATGSARLMVTGTGAKERLAQPCVAARETAGRCGGKRHLGPVQLMSHQGPVHEIGSRIVLHSVFPLSPEDMEQTINVTHASVVSMKNRT